MTEPLIYAVERLLVMEASARYRRKKEAAAAIGMKERTFYLARRRAGFLAREQIDGAFDQDRARVLGWLLEQPDPGFDRAFLGC